MIFGSGRVGADGAQAGEGAVAIIGISCRFPGAAHYDAYWQNLKEGVDSVTEIPCERWGSEAFSTPDPVGASRSDRAWCGVLDGIDQFDNAFFDISPPEARAMDPQQRLMLEETWRCIEDSGVPLAQLQQKVTSVFSGVLGNEYCQELSREGEVDRYLALGNYESILANRISYLFGLRGASRPVNAACASSLVAIHEARRSLLQGESDFALASGVNLNVSLRKYVCLSKSRTLSPNGRCRPFDKDADGFVPGDGVAVLLLARLSDALRGRSHIYGIIKGSAVNHGGKGHSLTSPRIEAQRDVILSAYQDARISPETVTYLEAHGTGTPAGDSIEIEALTRAFRRYTPKSRFCAIGSVKSNIGHLEAASGMAAVVKVLLMFRHREIPRTLHVTTPNPVIDFDATPFEVATVHRKWEGGEDPLRAGVSSFGLSGVNSHLLLEEYRADTPAVAEPVHGRHIFTLSAKNPESLKEMWGNWRRHLKKGGGGVRLDDLCGTLLTGRGRFPYRMGVTARDLGELCELLAEEPRIGAGEAPPWALQIGVLPWEGFHAVRGLCEAEPLYQENLERVLLLIKKRRPSLDLQGHFGKEPWEEEKRLVNRFIAGHAFLTTLTELGFAPTCVAGEEEGIWNALALCGILDPEGVVDLILGVATPDRVWGRRPAIPFHDPLSGETVLTFHLSREYLALLLNPPEIPVDILSHHLDKMRLLHEGHAAYRTLLEEWEGFALPGGGVLGMLGDPQLLSGEKRDKERFLALLVLSSCLARVTPTKGVPRKRLPDSESFCELLDLLLDQVLPNELLWKLLTDDEPDLAAAAVFLTARQDRLDPKKPYHLLKAHQRESAALADFPRWLSQATSLKPHPFFAENAQLLRIGSSACPVKGAFQVDPAAPATLREVLLKCWRAGADLSWEKLYPPGSFQRLPLPGYAFRRESFWIARLAQKTGRAKPQTRAFPLFQAASDGSHQRFTARLNGDEFYLVDHLVKGKKTLPEVVLLEMVQQVGALAAGIKVYSLNENLWLQPVVVEDAPLVLEVTLVEECGGLRYQVASVLEDGEQTVHAKGSIAFGGGADESELSRVIDLKEVQGRCLSQRGGKDCYQAFQKIGLVHGPSFRVIRTLSFSKDEALSLLLFTPTPQTMSHPTTLNPALMDGALQTVMALLGDQGEDAGALLPNAIGETLLLRPLPEKLFAYARRVDSSRFEVALVEESGTPCVWMREIVLRQPVCSPRKPAGASLLEQPYLPVWRECPLTASGTIAPTASKEAVLIVSPADSLGLAESLAAALSGQRVLKLRLGSRTLIHSDGTQEVAPWDLATLEPLPFELKTIGTVYFLGGIWSEGVELDDLYQLEKSQELGIFSFFRLVKLLLRECSPEEALHIKVVTNDLHPVSPHDQIIPYGGSLTGLARSLGEECPGWRVTCVDLASWELRGKGGVNLSEVIRALVLEPGAPSGEPVALRRQARYLRALEPASLPAAKNPPFKERGVFLVLGGAPERARDLGRYLCRSARAKVALVSDRETRPELAGKVVQLAPPGGEIISLRGEVGDPEQMYEVVEEVRKRLGRVNGVFHLGGAPQERLLSQLDEESLRDALKEWVTGSVMLQGALQGEPLDFFIMLSPLLAVTGGAGKSGHLAGCAFAEAFAAALDATHPYRAQFLNVGVLSPAPLSAPSEGGEWMETLARALAHPATQLLFAGDGLCQTGELSGDFLPAPQVKALADEGDLHRATPWEPEAAAPALRPVDGETDLAQEGPIAPAPISPPWMEAAEPEAKAAPDTEAVTPAPSSSLEAATAPSFVPKGGPVDSAAEDSSHARARGEAIAVIGMSGRYPKAEDLDELWMHLQKGELLVDEVPPGRFDLAELRAKELQTGGLRSRLGGYLADVDRFDPLLFRVSPEEAALMDPQERLFLEGVWRLFEDAGLTRRGIARMDHRVGVFVGVTNNDYLRQGGNSTSGSIAGRVSSFFDLRGPSLAVDTAGSSSLTAIHLACESLRRGECRAAVAGGVNLILHPEHVTRLNARNLLASGEACRPFGSDADGYLPGEGVGALLLKPLSLARLAGDRIHAVILGSALNAGGGHPVRNPDAQAELIRDALSNAGVDPESLSCIEAHGAGTALEDAAEVAGLTRAFRETTGANGFCALGAVTSNLGQLESAAGIAGVTKVLLQLRHRQLVPSLNAERANPQIDFADTPFFVPKALAPWCGARVAESESTLRYPLRAGISSFGALGANAHLILEGFTPVSRCGVRVEERPQLILLSAENREKLKKYAQDIVRFLEKVTAGAPKGASRSIEKRLMFEAAAILEVHESHLSPDVALFEYGFEARSLTRLAERVNEEFGTAFTVAIFAQCLTLGALARRLEAGEGPAPAPPCREGGGITLSDLAFTLQTGREEMDERLALVVWSLDELCSGLAAFCAGREVAGGCHGSASVDAGRGGSPVGGEGEASLDTFLGRRDLPTLAKLWTGGATVAWELLWGDSPATLVPLPGYPFDREKGYWVAQNKPRSASPEPEKSQALPPPVASTVFPANPRLIPRPRELAGEKGYTGSEVTLEIVDQSIALVQMQDRAHRNMFSENLVQGLASRFTEIRRDERIKVIVITGYDAIFSMGGSREELGRISEGSQNFADPSFLYLGLLLSPVPVIAAMQGHAVGGGLAFGLFADIVVMASDGVYSANFMNFGAPPGLGATFILQEKLGKGLSSEMMFTARPFQGEELRERGGSLLFRRREKVLDEALSIASRLCDKPLSALKLLKRGISGRILEQLYPVVSIEEGKKRAMKARPEAVAGIEERVETVTPVANVDLDEAPPYPASRACVPEEGTSGGVTAQEPFAPAFAPTVAAPRPDPGVGAAVSPFRPERGGRSAPPLEPPRGGIEDENPQWTAHVVESPFLAAASPLEPGNRRLREKETIPDVAGAPPLHVPEAMRPAPKTAGAPPPLQVLQATPSPQAKASPKDPSPPSKAPNLDLLRRLEAGEIDLEEAARLLKALEVDRG